MQTKISVFTDGSSLGNPGPGGYGAVLVFPEGKVEELGGYEAKTTNNRMEMMAALAALRYAVGAGVDEVEINTDSSYMLNGITKWVHGWQRSGWITSTKQEVLNRDLWEALIEASAALVEQGARVSWNKVKGHDGEVLNERADHIATSFASGEPVPLFKGARNEYQSIMDEEEARAKKANTGAKKKSSKSSGPAYSYVSMIDGKIETHKTWSQCEARVRGAKGARFKKAMSAADEKDIIAEFQAKR